MKNNILSLGQLLKKVYDFHMKNYSISLRDRQRNLIIKVSMLKNIEYPKRHCKMSQKLRQRFIMALVS